MDIAASAIIEVLLVVTGRLVVWLFSLGRWRGEALGSDEGRIYSAAGSLSFVRDGQRVVTQTGQLFVGLIFYVLLFALAVAYAATV